MTFVAIEVERRGPTTLLPDPLSRVTRHLLSVPMRALRRTIGQISQNQHHAREAKTENSILTWGNPENCLMVRSQDSEAHTMVFNLDLATSTALTASPALSGRILRGKSAQHTQMPRKAPFLRRRITGPFRGRRRGRKMGVRPSGTPIQL
jgi:hypothetical protein